MKAASAPDPESCPHQRRVMCYPLQLATPTPRLPVPELFQVISLSSVFIVLSFATDKRPICQCHFLGYYPLLLELFFATGIINARLPVPELFQVLSFVAILLSSTGNTNAHLPVPKLF